MGVPDPVDWILFLLAVFLGLFAMITMAYYTLIARNIVAEPFAVSLGMTMWVAALLILAVKALTTSLSLEAEVGHLGLAGALAILSFLMGLDEFLFGQNGALKLLGLCSMPLALVMYLKVLYDLANLKKE